MPSSEKSTVPAKIKAKKKKSESTKKVGNPGNFQGARLTFLEAQLPIYLSKKGCGEVSEYFTKMLGLWWTTFPWYEGYGPDGTPVPKEKGVSAPPRAGEMLGVGGITPAPTASTDASAPTTSADASSTDAPTATTTTAMPSTDVSLTPASVIASAGQWVATGGVNPEFRDKIKGEVAAVRTRLNYLEKQC
jgi:hypothetical protein